MRRLAQASLGLLAWNLLLTFPGFAQLKGNPDILTEHPTAVAII